MSQEVNELSAMHHNSIRRKRVRSTLRYVRSVRYPRKASRGGGLYILVSPRGSRCWRYNYRYQGRYKTLALGIYPDVPEEWARFRHKAARQLLAEGIDPSLRMQELRLAFSSERDF